MQSPRGLTLVAITLLSLLSVLAFSQSGTTQLSQPPTLVSYCFFTNGTASVGNCLLASIPLAILGVLLSFALIAVAYMAGEIFNVGGLKGFYRKELWEASKSVMLIAIVYSVVLITGSMAAAFTGNLAGSGTSYQYTGSNFNCATSSYQAQYSGGGVGTDLGNLYLAAESYLCYASQQITSSFSGLLGLSIGIGALKSVQLSVWSPIPPLYIPPDLLVGSVQSGSTAYIYANEFLVSIRVIPTYSYLGALMKLVNGLLVLFVAQKDLLPLIVNTGLGILLPIGIFLRALPFVRGIGGAFVAMGIGVAIVYPVLLIALNYPIASYVGSAITAPSYTSTACTGGALACIGYSIIGSLNLLATSSLSYALTYPSLTYLVGSGSVLGAGNPKVTAAAVNGFKAGFYNSINSIYPALNASVTYGLISVVEFILLVFDLILGVIIIQNIARLLGGQIRLSIGKMKLA